MATYKVRPVAVGMLPRGSKYTVKDLGDSAQGYIRMIEQEIGVSRNAELPWTRFTQGHEMTHVAISKCLPEKMAKKAGIDTSVAYQWHDYVNAGEDARVNTWLRRAVPDILDGFSYPEDMELRMDLPGYMASWGMPEEIRMRVRKALESYGYKAECKRIDAECERLTRKGNLAESKFTIPLIRLMAELSRAKQPEPPKPQPEDGEGEGKGQDEEQEGERQGQDEQPQEGQGQPSKAEQEQDAKDEEEMGAEEGEEQPWQDKPPLAGDPSTDERGSARWVIPEVLTPALTVTVQRPGTHNSIACDSGVQLRDITRIASDGMVFGRSRMRPGSIRRGAFLVDVSGSMSLSMHHVDEIIDAVPAALIIMYSGRAQKAEIVVIGKDGKRCKADDIHMLGGNYCDGPALLFLSRQPGPRFWYSDARVTNYRGMEVPQLREECMAICKAARIQHIDPRNDPSYDRCQPELQDHGAWIVKSLKNLKMIR